MLGLVHEGGELGDLGPELIGDQAPLGPGTVGVVLGEGGGDEGGDDTPPLLADMGEQVARMKCMRQRWEVAPRMRVVAAFRPLWSSAITSFTPRRPQRRRNSVQKVSASDTPTAMPRISRRP